MITINIKILPAPPLPKEGTYNVQPDNIGYTFTQQHGLQGVLTTHPKAAHEYYQTRHWT